MRRSTLGAVLLLLFAAGCQKPLNEQQEIATEPQAVLERKCAADDVLQAQLLADPALRDRMQSIEAFTRQAVQESAGRGLLANAVNIPVVVHVVYNTNAQNISLAQIQSQIAVLNEDFKNTNADGSKLPSGSFQSVVSGGMNVNFVLDRVVPVKTRVKSFSSNDAVKSSNRGGSNAIDPTTKLNVWVCNLGGGLLGYAQFPGGNPSTDGVVVLYSAFGSKDKYSSGTYVSRFDKGRTATHEVGHWLNLRHIWGDDGTGCSGSDLVGDTPNQGGYNVGCPTYPKLSCGNTSTGDMFMNYMDYTDDACMYMFTLGQKSRAEAVFVSGGPRAGFVQ